MYNGIGLPTPRGSGTNGYVQRNLAHARTRRHRPYTVAEPDKSIDGAPNPAIALHQQKRRIEAKCLVLREELEEEGLSEEKIKREVDKYRQRKLAGLTDSNRANDIKRSFGIQDDYVEGSAVTRMNKKPDLKKEPKDEPKEEPTKLPKKEPKEEPVTPREESKSHRKESSRSHRS